jgi:xanthosine utilization system XapX-like protein
VTDLLVLLVIVAIVGLAGIVIGVAIAPRIERLTERSEEGHGGPDEP